MVRRGLVAAAALVLLPACSSSQPAAQDPTPSPPGSRTPAATSSPSKRASPTPRATTTGARVFEFSRGQAALEIRGDAPLAGSYLLDRVFSEPPSGGEADGTYGWFTASGDERLVLNVPKAGAWTLSGTVKRTQLTFAQCTVKTERNDAAGLVGTFTCTRVTRAGTVAPAWTASAEFAQEP